MENKNEINEELASIMFSEIWKVRDDITDILIKSINEVNDHLGRFTPNAELLITNLRRVRASAYAFWEFVRDFRDANSESEDCKKRAIQREKALMIQREAREEERRKRWGNPVLNPQYEQMKTFVHGMWDNAEYLYNNYCEYVNGNAFNYLPDTFYEETFSVMKRVAQLRIQVYGAIEKARKDYLEKKKENGENN